MSRQSVPDKMIPHNVEAEEATLGALLIDPEATLRVFPLVDPDEFYVQKNGWLYEAILALHERREPIDFVTLCDELEQRGQLVEVGGAAYVTRLINAVPSALHAETYASIVADAAERRRYIVAASQIAQLAYGEGLDQDELRRLVKESLARAGNGRVKAEALSALDAVHVLYTRAGEWADNPLKPGQVRGLSSGLADLDKMLSGLDTGLYLVGAVQHTGKTALCQQVARNVAASGGRVLFFSLEHTAEYMYQRIASAETGIAVTDVQRGLNGAQLIKYFEALDYIREWPIEIIGKQLTLAQMEAEIQARDDLRLAVIDNLELASRSVGNDKDYVMLRNAAYQMLAIAQSSQVPIMTTMQIGTKMVAQRADKRPDIADLYGSDGPAQASSVVLLMHRADRWTFDEREKTNEVEVACWKDKVNFMGTGRRATFQFWKQGQIRNQAQEDNGNGNGPLPVFGRDC